jgi:hypothetical protein
MTFEADRALAHLLTGLCESLSQSDEKVIKYWGSDSRMPRESVYKLKSCKEI